MIHDQCIISDIEGTSRNMTRAMKRAMPVEMFRESARHQPYVVIDIGTEREVIGGVGWQILNFPDKSEPLSGTLAGMGTEVLPSVNAFAAVNDQNGNAVLLGVRGAAYDQRTTQYESLWNYQQLRS